MADLLKRYIKMKMLAAVLAAPAALADAGDAAKEDPSCRTVNVAYQATWSAERISTEIKEERPDGALVLVAETRETKSHSYVRNLPSNTWQRYPKLRRPTLDAFGPKFTDCKLEGEEERQGQTTRHYSAVLHEFPKVATIDLWVSTASSRVVEFRFGPFAIKVKSGPKLVEVLKFDADATPSPD